MSLRSTGRQEVPLQEELEFLQRYLEIMRLRFGDRLSVDVQAEPEVLDARVPSLMLQPLVENAIRHGFQDARRRGHVAVEITRAGDVLQCSVADDGCGLPDDGFREGVGLTTTRARLRHLYARSISSSFAIGRRVARAPRWPFLITPSTARRQTNMDFPKIRTMIVDDEELGRERVRMMLAEHPDIEVVAECSDGPEAVRTIERERPDLVFLDVQMPGMNGFEVLESLEGEPMPAVVFVTAHDDYALRAFDIHALDFLLKPFDNGRFEKTLERARVQVSQARGTAVDSRILSLLEDLKSDRKYPERLIVKSGGRVFFLRAEEIDWVEAAGNYVRLHARNESHLLRESMKNMEANLDTKLFVRIHSSAIVNVDRIKELEPWFHGEYIVIMRDGTRLTASRVFSDRLSALIA
jgi:two-component system LytT family response regulator